MFLSCPVGSHIEIVLHLLFFDINLFFEVLTAYQVLFIIYFTIWSYIIDVMDSWCCIVYSVIYLTEEKER